LRARSSAPVIWTGAAAPVKAAAGHSPGERRRKIHHCGEIIESMKEFFQAARRAPAARMQKSDRSGKSDAPPPIGGKNRPRSVARRGGGR
jgi:hypothetical protein